MNHDWPDIPDTPEQRALIAAHNSGMKRKHPDLVEIDAPKPKGRVPMVSTCSLTVATTHMANA